jgi:peptidyl-prolyl cis-trans isomerase C
MMGRLFDRILIHLMGVGRIGLGNRRQRIIFIGASLFALSTTHSAVWSQQSAEIKHSSLQTIVQIGDYAITVNDLEKIIETYPEGSISSRDSKRRLVESLITTKLFALAARSAKLDRTDDFREAKAKARENVLAFTYYQRTVKPKFSDEEARRYFQAHKDEFPNFFFSRTKIIALLRDQALASTSKWLMQQVGVKQRDDLLKDLDLRTAQDSSVVLAQIGEAVVTVGDLKRLAALYPNENLTTFAAKKDLLETLVLERLYAVAAEKAGLMNDPEVQKSFVWSEDKLLEAQYTHLIEGKVTLEDAQRYYQAHPEEFKRPDQLLLRQIVVATPEEARTVKAGLDRGESFEEVARMFSTDRTSAAKGGEVGWVRQGGLYPEVEKVAFQLKPNQVSEPIKTPNGYYLVKVEEHLEGVVRPFEQVGPNLLLRLKMLAIDDERKRLMMVYKTTINEELL